MENNPANSPEVTMTAWAALDRGDFEVYQSIKRGGHAFVWIDDCGRHPLHVAAMAVIQK